MSQEDEDYQKKLDEWYLNTRKEYLKDYLEKTEARNKYLLLGTGGGILSILKFLELFKEYKYVQGIGWILMLLFFLLGITTLFSYIYGAKASEKYLELIEKYYRNQGEDINLNENKYHESFKNISKYIERTLYGVIFFVVLFFISTFYVKVIYTQEEKIMKEIKVEKKIESVKPSGRVSRRNSFDPPVPPKKPINKTEESTKNKK